MSLFCIRNGLNAKQSPRGAVCASSTNHQNDFINKRQHSLQVQAPEVRCCSGCRGRKGISLLASSQKGRKKHTVRASLTVEAALAMSLFLFAVMGLLGFFFVIRTEIQIQTAMEQTGNQLSGIPEEASIPSAYLLFREKLSVNHADVSLIIGGADGISLEKSTVMGQTPVIDLAAVYRIRLPFFPEHTAGLTIVQRSRKIAFGASEFLVGKAEGYVYVAENGEVYHETMDCTYIRPKTEEIPFSDLGARRNQDGRKYRPCEFCCTGEPLTIVWITGWGDCYHQSDRCRGLWHNIRKITRQEAEGGGLRACSKCAKGETAG